jgi:hypothetical protein
MVSESQALTEADGLCDSLKKILAGCQWLEPVTLATWEAEIGRITTQGQPRQIVHETPLQNKNGLELWLKQ